MDKEIQVVLLGMLLDLVESDDLRVGHFDGRIKDRCCDREEGRW